MKGKFFLLLVVFFGTSFINNSRAASIHEKCLKAKDYEGCVNTLSKMDNKSKNNIFNIFKPNKLTSCKKDLKNLRENNSNLNITADRDGEFSSEAYDLACESILVIDKNYNLFSDSKKACFLANYNYSLVDDDKLIKKIYTPRNLSKHCDCYEKESLKNQSWYYSQNIDTSISCGARNIYTFKNGGYRYFNSDVLLAVFHDRNNTWDYALNDNSVKQKRIREKYGRYITFYGKTNNPYAGGYIPEEPGYIDCDWGGSGSSFYNEDSGRGSWSSGGYCYGEEGKDAIVIPDGVDKKFYKYNLDCLDLTFDRKGDRVNYQGGVMKGWMTIENDPTAFMAAKIYCPIIKNLPKE
tara:strand:- start:1655 stop:2707 length:1053 start_codon:yes stop_codon:yes gene_type:complete